MSFGIKDLVISIIFIGIFTLSLITGILGIAISNDKGVTDVVDDSLNLTLLNTTMAGFDTDSEDWEELSLGQELDVFNEGKGFDILSTIKSVWETTKLTATFLIQMISNVLHIPPIFTKILFAILVVVGIMSLWKLWKLGE